MVDFLCFRVLAFFFLFRRLISTSSELELLLESDASDELELLLDSYFFFDLPILLSISY